MNDEPESKQSPPADPMTVLAETAVQMHELYLSYVAAGFTEGQSMTLVAAILDAIIRHQLEGGST